MRTIKLSNKLYTVPAETKEENHSSLFFRLLPTQKALSGLNPATPYHSRILTNDWFQLFPNQSTRHSLVRKVENGTN